MPTQFTGVLNSNEIYAALFNMIISQQVFADNIAGTYGSLVDKSRVDGSLYGDTKLYYATDALSSREWGADAEATNLLSVNRADAPRCQKITLDVFRQIDITVDDYLSKRAWATEGAFSDFNGVILAWIRDTKRIYDATTFNAFIGTTVSNVGKQSQAIDLDIGGTSSTASDKEAANRGQALIIANAVADIFTELKDVSRDYNDYGYIRSYNEDDLVVVWNSKYVNMIRTVDLPTIFHKDGLIKKFEEEVLPAKYFGQVNSAATAGNAAGTVRSLVEQDIGDNHYFAGEAIKVGDTAPAGSSYTVQDEVICKIIHRRSVPFMSAFEVGTSFFNPRSLTTNHYLTWGHNSLDYLADKPFITLSAA